VEVRFSAAFQGRMLSSELSGRPFGLSKVGEGGTESFREPGLPPTVVTVTRGLLLAPERSSYGAIAEAAR
jgi:hypothetical protein